MVIRSDFFERAIFFFFLSVFEVFFAPGGGNSFECPPHLCRTCFPFIFEPFNLRVLQDCASRTWRMNTFAVLSPKFRVSNSPSAPTNFSIVEVLCLGFTF